jgi:hypothetical protein
MGGWEVALDTLQGSREYTGTTEDVSIATAKQVGKRPKIVK